MILNDHHISQHLTSTTPATATERGTMSTATSNSSDNLPEQHGTILSKELSNHYVKHGVPIESLDEYIVQKRFPLSNAATISSSSTSAQDSLGGGSRFIRLNPRYDAEETLKLLKSELPLHSQPPTRVPWLSPQLAFYAIPDNFRLSQSQSFRSGRIYGMDVSSGAAVAALLLNDHDDDHDVQSNEEDDESASRSECAEKVTVTVRESETNRNVKLETPPLSKGLRVLDLCCAPGLKTCAIADLLTLMRRMNSSEQNFSSKEEEDVVIGVDISQHRMNLCSNIIKKYHVNTETNGDLQFSEKEPTTAKCTTRTQRNRNHSKIAMRLYCADGTKFGMNPLDPTSLVFDSNVARMDHIMAGKRKRMNKSAKARQRRKLKELAVLDMNVSTAMDPSTGHKEVQPTGTVPLFDRVLVDAECSTDGAVRHLQHKYKFTNQEVDGGEIPVDASFTQNSKLIDSKELSELVLLQKRLIESGFRLLKPGGHLIYSTCSLASEQNEVRF